MPIESWRQLLERCGGNPACAVTGKSWQEAKLTVDHIVPRYEDGPDDVSNLQFLTVEENSRKGVRDDSYWKQEFYWDRPFSLANARASQQKIFDQVDRAYRSYFSRPRGEISRILYLVAAVVGSGKTLMIPAIAFAYNRVIRMEVGMSAPRADRILVLTKEAAIRDQLADEIEKELVKYGFVGQPPRVGVVRNGDLFEATGCIDQYDVLVACVQQLWTSGNGQPRRHLAKVLAHFPLVFIDEFHFATDQALRIVQAGDSLVFGMTSTPFKASGDIIKTCRLFFDYDYWDADRCDASLKYIHDDDAALAEIVEEVGITDAVLREGSVERQIFDVAHPGYQYALAAVKSVAERVVSYVQDCDQIEPTALFSKAAPHRADRPHVVDMNYPMHAMIVVDTIHMAHVVCQQLNHMFESDRRQFPVDHGYRAEVVCSDFEAADGTKSPPKQLTTDHPWLMYRNIGRLSEKRGSKIVYGCRFLIVVGMGREGVNNRYCGVIGIGKICDSLVEAVQRWIGRLLRSVCDWPKGDRLHVTPSRLDTVKIVAHKAFNVVPLVLRAIQFVLNQKDYLSEIPPLTDSEEEDVAPVAGIIDTGDSLTISDRVKIAISVGRERDGLPGPTVSKVIESISNGSDFKARRAQQWEDEVRNHPDRARTRLFFDGELPMMPAVMRESPTCTPSNDDLRRFLLRHLPDRAELIAELSRPVFRDIAEAWYKDHVLRFHIDEFAPVTNIDAIRKGMAAQVVRAFEGHMTRPRPEFTKAAHAFIGKAVKSLLGVDKGQSASVGSEWDRPQYHVILARPDIRMKISQFVQYRLVRGGYCSDLAKTFGIVEESFDAIQEDGDAV